MIQEKIDLLNQRYQILQYEVDLFDQKLNALDDYIEELNKKIAEAEEIISFVSVQRYDVIDEMDEIFYKLVELNSQKEKNNE